MLESAPSLLARFPSGGARGPATGCQIWSACGRTAPRLHAELGVHWALLAADGSTHACVMAARKRLGDYVVVLAPVHGGSGEVLLVRPDAHLDWRGRPGRQ